MKKQLHPSAQRLYKAAGKLSPPLTSQAEIARELNESEQRINNWESRPTGISAQGCISIQKKLGINASWLQDGEGEMFVLGVIGTLSERLAVAMHDRPGTKPVDLARACNVRAPSVSDWLSGKTKKMEGANLLSAAAFLNVDPWWLATGEGSKNRKPDAPEPASDWTMQAVSPSARAAINAIQQADRNGVSADAFNALREMLHVVEAALMESARKPGMDDPFDIEDPYPG